MKKVEFLSFVSVDEMIEKVKNEIEYLNNGFEWEDIKNCIIENGSGVYEFCFGCRGGLEDFDKNDEYVSIDEMIRDSGESMEELIASYGVESEEEVVANFEEFYSDNENFVLEGEESWAKCVSFYEESWSLFVNVKV